jgi:hypothetical protein
MRHGAGAILTRTDVGKRRKMRGRRFKLLATALRVSMAIAIVGSAYWSSFHHHRDAIGMSIFFLMFLSVIPLNLVIFLLDYLGEPKEGRGTFSDFLKDS